MHEKDNYLKTAELSTEQNCNPTTRPSHPRPRSWTQNRLIR